MESYECYHTRKPGAKDGALIVTEWTPILPRRTSKLVR